MTYDSRISSQVPRLATDRVRCLKPRKSVLPTKPDAGGCSNRSFTPLPFASGSGRGYVGRASLSLSFTIDANCHRESLPGELDAWCSR